MAQGPRPNGDVWLFGYGSLLWDVPFPHREAKPARLTGWHRAMCVWSALARGTPDCPGLSLGLMPGGECDGMAYRIAGTDLDTALPIIWEREIWTDIYQPAWLPLDVDGAGVAALAFTVNQASRQFAAGLSHDQIVQHIALAHGERGPCRDYLSDTVARLRDMGITDTSLEVLQDAVARAPDTVGRSEV